MQISALIVGIYTSNHIIKEYRSLVEQNEEIKKLRLSKKQKKILLSILGIFLIGITIIYIVDIIYTKNEIKRE